MWWGMGTAAAAALAVVLLSELKIRVVYRGRRLTVRLIYACFSVIVWPRPPKKHKRPAVSGADLSDKKKRLSARDLRHLAGLLRHLPAVLREHLPSLCLKVHRCLLCIGGREADRTAYLTMAADASLGTIRWLCGRLFPRTEWENCGIFPDYLTPRFRADADIEISVRGTELVTTAVWLVRRYAPLRSSVGQAKPVTA